MAETELVNEIVRQVMAALGGGAPVPARGVTTEAAKPQAATTTQLQEARTTQLQEARSSEPQEARSSEPQEARSSEPQAAVKRVSKVFITEEMLSRRIAAGGMIVKLAHNERLTPAAVDLVEEKHLTVTTAKAPLILSASPAADSLDVQAAAPSPAGTIGLVVDKADAKVTSVVTSLGYDGLALADYNVGECWLVNLQGLCDAVASGAVAAGVAILPHAADAMVVANKIRGVRAVQGTRAESVASALRHFDANVLILEHAFSMFHEMRAMVRLFAAERTAAAAGGVVLGAIDKLERT